MYGYVLAAAIIGIYALANLSITRDEAKQETDAVSVALEMLARQHRLAIDYATMNTTASGAVVLPAAVETALGSLDQIVSEIYPDPDVPNQRILVTWFPGQGPMLTDREHDIVATRAQNLFVAGRTEFGFAQGGFIGGEELPSPLLSVISDGSPAALSAIPPG